MADERAVSARFVCICTSASIKACALESLLEVLEKAQVYITAQCNAASLALK